MQTHANDIAPLFINPGLLQMLSYVWIPTKDLFGWRGLYIFKKGGSYLGIPYTQAADQVN